MKWFFPSWNGDFRLEKQGDDQTALVMVSPTAHELEILGVLAKSFREKQWWAGEKLWQAEGEPYRDQPSQRVTLAAPIDKVAPLVTKLMKPGKQTLTAVVFKDGLVETVEGATSPSMADLAVAASKEGVVAATVKRLTPCCPECIPGSIGPAREVLLSFLSKEQHDDWAKHRYLIAYGSLSGHPYLLAHRHSRLAQQQGKICRDLDDDRILHFHDWSVPPEEEVLAAKLILEHREPWLRNEATLAGIPTGFAYSDWSAFKNPFGDGMDGTLDASFTTLIGTGLAMLSSSLPAPQAAAPRRRRRGRRQNAQRHASRT
jgi:hypothetical protein